MEKIESEKWLLRKMKLGGKYLFIIQLFIYYYKYIFTRKNVTGKFNWQEKIKLEKMDWENCLPTLISYFIFILIKL